MRCGSVWRGADRAIGSRRCACRVESIVVVLLAQTPISLAELRLLPAPPLLHPTPPP